MNVTQTVADTEFWASVATRRWSVQDMSMMTVTLVDEIT